MDQLHQTTDTETATAIIKSSLGPELNIIKTVPLHGGMVNRVEKWLTDAEPSTVVVKLNSEPDCEEFRTEFESLRWYRKNSDLPVPEPYACTSNNDAFLGTCLLMEAVPGVNLGRAKLSANGARNFQTQLAETLADLHDITRDTYGSALAAAGPERWLDIFAPQIEENFSKCASMLSSAARSTIEKMLSELQMWLPEYDCPTLIHGDIWANNIMIDDTDPDKPAITAFLDVSARFAEVEYELAYLRVFSTADETFFNEYTERHALRPEFDRRSLIYWLNTMMLHVWMFGPSYAPSCEDIAGKIASIS